MQKRPNAPIPTWLKWFVTAWAVILVPSYAMDSAYGLLWFCNVGLVLTVIGVWTERPLLISIPALGNVPWLLLWSVHLGVKVVGLVLDRGIVDGPASYMFNADYPVYVRILSIYHGWLPLVLLYAVWRVGYDRRAPVYQTLIAWALILAAYLIVPNAETPAGNVNLVFGYTADKDPILWTSQLVWIILLSIFCPLVLYLPMHLIYMRLFRRLPDSLTISEPRSSRCRMLS